MNTAVYFLLFLLTLLSGCGLFENEQATDFFSVKPISAVEVALEIQAAKGEQITIERDGIEIFFFRMGRSDTVVYDSDLSPATSYIWKATNHARGLRSVPIERQATTLDTTSHTFIWQKFEFGENSSSFIRDVAIIDSNNIWAVGEIYMNDSTGQEDVTPYNVVHWDGINWEVIRLRFNCRLYYPNCGPNTDWYANATNVTAFSSNDVWIMAGSVHHFDGGKWEQFAGVQGTGSAKAVWGSSSKNLWFVGNSGFLAHYDGERWQKLESGTSLNINDIWGSRNPHTGKWEVLAVASEPWSTTEERLLSISGTTVNILPANEPDLIMNSIWFQAGQRYFIGGNELFNALSKEGDWWQEERFNPGFPGAKQAIRGTGLNDMYVTGTHGLIMHFNGARWKLYEDQLLLPFGSGSYTSLSVKEDIVVAGGVHGSKGIVLIGRRE